MDVLVQIQRMASEARASKVAEIMRSSAQIALSARPPPGDPPKRDERGRLLPGQSLNAGGRPKGLARRIRELTDDGEELIQYHLACFRNPLEPRAYRHQSAQWLSDHGHGRAPEVLHVTNGDPEDPTNGAPAALRTELLGPADLDALQRITSTVLEAQKDADGAFKGKPPVEPIWT